MVISFQHLRLSVFYEVYFLLESMHELKHYNGLIHAGILRENRLHKKQIKEEAEKKLPLFIRDLKFGKSPASVKKLNREFERWNKERQMRESA